MTNAPQFYLQRLLNLQVLSHSKAFEGFDLQESIKELERWQASTGGAIAQMIVDLETEPLANRWKAIFSEVAGALQLLGPSLPLSLLAFYQREIAKLDPELYLGIMQNFIAAELLKSAVGADDPRVLALNEGRILAVIDWFPSSFGRLETTLQAQKKEENIFLVGRKNSMLGQFQELDLPRLYLVYAKPEGSAEEFLYLVDQGDIQIQFDVKSRELGMAHVNFGHEKPCPGMLIGADQNALLEFQASARMQLLLLQSCLADQAYLTALSFGQSQLIKDLGEEEREVALLYHPLAGDMLLELKALREGLTGAMLQIAFYQDCVNQAESEAKKYFEDLLEVYLVVFKVYNSWHVPSALQKALQLTGNHHLELLQSMQLSTVAGLLAGPDLELSAQLVSNILTKDEGRVFQNLMSELNQVSALRPKTDSLKETIGIFSDFVGGLFILVDDLKQSKEESTFRADLVHARRITDLFGDVMLCDLLIRQAYEAELVLDEMGVNFFNLGQQAISNPEIRPYFNLIVLVEQFSAQHLARQESQIRIIQKNLAPALDALLEVEGKPST